MQERRVILTGVILVVSVVFYLLGAYSVHVPYVDRKAEEYFSTTSKMAVVGYATTRIINAAVSMAKESSVELGIGARVNIAAGQVLDPLDDITEKLSSIFLLVIISLGIQKIAMIIGNVVTFKAGAFVLWLLIPGLWIKKDFFFNLSSMALKIIVVLMALRFFLPVSALINDFIYSQFLRPQIEQAKQMLAASTEISEEEVETMSTESVPDDEEKGWFEKLKEKVLSFGELLKTKAITAIKVAKNVLANLDEITKALVALATLYIALFVIQCLVIPLGMLWVIVKFLDVFFKTRFEERFVNKLRELKDISVSTKQPKEAEASSGR